MKKKKIEKLDLRFFRLPIGFELSTKLTEMEDKLNEIIEALNEEGE